MALTIPLINGIAYDWAGIEIRMFGITVKGVTKIAYKRMQAIVDNPGAGREPVSRGYGNATYEASITLDEIEVRRILDAAGPGSCLTDIPPFEIVVNWTAGTKSTTDIIHMAQFMEDGVSVSSGDTTHLRDIPLKIAGFTQAA